MTSSVIAAFSADQIAKLTGLTLRQLSYWDSTDFFSHQYAAENRRSPHSRIYSFSDLVGLRTVSLLKNRYKVSMSHLKQTADKLTKYTSRPWSDVRLAVWNRQVTWIEPDTGKPASVVDGQYILFELIDVIQDMEKEAMKLRSRDIGEFGQMTRNRNVAHNKPVFAGTRIPVSSVINFADAGYTIDQIIKEYPSLTESDISTAIHSKKSRSVA